jgi:hypothetical protein
VPTIRYVHGVSIMTSAGEHYRIRIREHRLGITMDGETAILRRFLPRGEIYRYFPWRTAAVCLDDDLTTTGVRRCMMELPN